MSTGSSARAEQRGLVRLGLSHLTGRGGPATPGVSWDYTTWVKSEVDSEAGDFSDAAQPLTAQGEDDAITESLRTRLDTIDRALHRLDDGTYGRSTVSGEPIPDERLEADPAAELTIEEARAAETR